MLYLHVHVGIVHTVYENAPLYFVLNIKHGASEFYVLLGAAAKYSYEAPRGWRCLFRGLPGTPGEGPL